VKKWEEIRSRKKRRGKKIKSSGAGCLVLGCQDGWDGRRG
jgi:hypothetical protein